MTEQLMAIFRIINHMRDTGAKETSIKNIGIEYIGAGYISERCTANRIKEQWQTLFSLSAMKSIIISLLFMLFSMLTVVHADASTKGVIVTPTRLVFEGRTRSEVVKIINTNDTRCTYRISLVNIRMDDLGNRSEVEAPTEAEIAAKDMVRFSPRSVVLDPGKWQTVRMMVRKPADLPSGEYRVHLKVMPVPDQANSSEDSNSGARVGVKIDYILAITIPVIIRNGKGGAKVIPQSVSLKRGEKNGGYFFSTELARIGEFSSYFSITAFYTPAGSSERVKVGELKGVSIYTPNVRQHIEIPVSIADPSLMKDGKVDIEVVSNEDKSLPLIGQGTFTLKQ